jgi:hypothetical protein
MAKTKTKAKPERTSLMLSRDDFELLHEVRRANGWSVREATRRAVHALFALDAYLQGRAEQQDGQRRNVLERIRRDVDPGLLLEAKPMKPATTAGGGVGVQVGDNLAFFVEDDRLLARREINGQIEVYEVLDGRLVLVYPTGPAIELSLN